MRTRPELAKLAELRAKTDSQLIAIIDKELERGLTLMGSDEAASRNAYREATELLPIVFDPRERRRLEDKAGELAAMLDGRRSRPAAA